MATKRHKPEEIVTKLRQIEVFLGQGAARVDTSGWINISSKA
jgi:putative transposase